MADVLRFELERVPDQQAAAVAAQAAPPSPAKGGQAAAPLVNMLMLVLRTLAQRTIVALSKLFVLLTVGSVFWLCLTLPEPNTLQLVQIGMYCLFVLAANYLVIRQRTP